MTDGPIPTPTPYLDPQSVAFGEKAAKVFNGRQISDLSLQEFRQGLRELQSPPPKDPGISITEFSVHTSHGVVKTYLFRPKSANSDPLPFIYHIHGGGWVSGDAFDWRAFVLDLVNRTGFAVVFPQYTLAPEEQFPVQQEQCLEVLQWLVKHAQTKHLLADKIVTSGDSAGGQLVPAVNILNLQRNLHLPISHQVLFHPLVDSTSLTSTFSQFLFQDGPFDTSALIEEFFNDYYGPLPGSAAIRKSILASPIHMTPAQAKEFMPPTTIITAQADWLRDQGQDFAKLLQMAGVSCGVIQGVAILHDAAVIDDARTSPTVELIMLAVAGKIKEVLGRGNGNDAIKGGNEKEVENGQEHDLRELKRKRRP